MKHKQNPATSPQQTQKNQIIIHPPSMSSRNSIVWSIAFSILSCGHASKTILFFDFLFSSLSMELLLTIINIYYYNHRNQKNGGMDWSKAQAELLGRVPAYLPAQIRHLWNVPQQRLWWDVNKINFKPEAMLCPGYMLQQVELRPEKHAAMEEN